MKYVQTLVTLALMVFMAGCSNGKLDEKGFQISPTPNNQPSGLNRDSLKFETRPSSVLLTGIPNVRLTTIYKVNVNKKDNSTFIGSDSFHYRYKETEEHLGNNWNDNLIPGIEAVYGYNMVNVSHYDIQENRRSNFFERPVLIKTLYYPTFSKDTLNNKPIKREYFIVSVYNEDTNKDNFINVKDLRRLYLFNVHGEKQKALIPENYSIFQSDYDPDNDFMFVFAQLDANGNGMRDEHEPIHIFWIDLNDPNKTGQQY